MHVQPSRDRIRIGAPEELATSPRVVVELGTAPDGLPWLVRVDRSQELSMLFQVVPRVFGLDRREDLPPRVREALERDVAAGLMGIHELALDGTPTRAFVARKKLKRLLGPTLFSQLLEAVAAELPEAAGVQTNVGAMASRDQDEALLEAVDRSIESLRAKRHLLIDLASARAYSCSVRDTDRALRVPSTPVRPLELESLLAFGDVEVVLTATSGTWTVPLADRAAYEAGLRRLHHAQGGWVQFSIARQQILAQLARLARGVGELHARDRVHADLGPGNVLVPAGGAHAFDGLDLEAGSPATAATFEWAAPEQIVGHPVDPRTDVYALGKIAVAVVGGVMFGEETEYVVPIGGARSRRVKLLKSEGVFLDITDSDRDRAWQRAWQDLLGRAVSYDRTRRPANAAVFADELDAVLAQHPLATRMTLDPRFGDVVAIEGAGFAHVAVD